MLNSEAGRISRARIVTHGWLSRQRQAAQELDQERQSDVLSTTALLVPASQHPLVGGETPGVEFSHRLRAVLRRFEELTDRGERVEIFVPGSRHYDKRTGQVDKVALYDAAARWLVDRGVEPRSLHGKDWIDRHRPNMGIYSGAEEIAVAAAGFYADARYASVHYYCSPGQAMRASVYGLAYGIPLGIEIPQELSHSDGIEQFHSKKVLKFALDGLAKTIDPYGEGMLAAMTRDRIPSDGNTGTMPELLPLFADLPWYEAGSVN